MVLTRNLEKVLLQEESRAKDAESEPPETGAEDQPAPGDSLDDNGSGGADDVGSYGGEKENSDDGRSQSLRDPPTGGGDDNGSDGGSQSWSDPESTYSDEEEEEVLEPMRPLRMYFPPTEYSKKMKISTRCYLHDVFETFRDLRPALTDKEKDWFETHPQFKHIFHMPRDRNHKLQGIWTLLLRTACIEKKKEVWFVVNGVPIRYGLREHALISGLYSHNYPSGFAENKSGRMSFVEKYFKLGSTVRYQDLKPMIEKMKPSQKSDDRLKMLILYFLASIIKGQTKTGAQASSVDPFLLRAVGDLNLCRTFPWGRLSYDHILEGISKTMTHFNGAVPGIEKQDQPWPIPGFILPLELLAFEAIPQLGERFLKRFPGAYEECPKMCKSMFKKCDMKGIPFDRISAQLGTTKDIDNILTADASEKRLLERITEPEEDVDKHCVVVESWMKLANQSHVIFLKDMYEEDVARLAEAPPQNPEAVNPGAVNPEAVNTPSSELIELIHSMKKEMEERMTTIEKKVDRLEESIAPIEAYVNEQTGYMRRADENIWHDNSQGPEERVGDQNGEEIPTEGLGDPPEVIGEDVTEGLRDPPQEASAIVPPIIKKRTRFKQCSRKSTHSKRVRDEISKKLKEGHLKRQKQEEATGATRMSTRLAEKEKL